MIERTLHRTVVLGALLVAGFASTGLAQPCQIADATITAVPISSEQAAEIARCVGENAKDLTSTDPEKRKASRLALQRPFENPGVSTGFRFEYARALLPLLTTALQNPDDRIAVTALIVAGDVATDQTTGLLVNALRSDRPALRYDAAYGLRRTFEAMQRTAPAVDAVTVSNAIVALRDRTSVEPDGQVLKAYVAALLAGTEIPATHAPSARTDAVTGLCAGLGTQLKAPGGKLASPAVLESILKGADGIRIVLARPGIQVSPAEAKAASELAGRCIAYGARVLRAKGLATSDEEARETLAQTIAASETLLGQTALSLTAGVMRVPGRELGEKFRKAIDVPSEATFVNEATAVVGPEGLLSKAPFEFPKNHFLP